MNKEVVMEPPFQNEVIIASWLAHVPTFMISISLGFQSQMRKSSQSSLLCRTFKSNNSSLQHMNNESMNTKGHVSLLYCNTEGMLELPFWDVLKSKDKPMPPKLHHSVPVGN